MNPESTAKVVPVPVLLPELTTTVLPSNGQLVVNETEELRTASLAAMRANLELNPAWVGAPPPTDDFLLMFLRCEVFRLDKAADRYRKFWKTKLALCGEDKAASPIKVEDVKEALDTEFCQIVPGSRDREGRLVMLMNPGKVDKSIHRTVRILAVWYVLFAGLEDVEAQRRGFCIVTNLKTAKISQADHRFDKMVVDSVQSTLPVRVGSINICYPQNSFRVVWALTSPFLHKRVKQRVHVIPGTDANVQKALGDKIALEDLPQPMGAKPLDISTWLAERARSEGL